MNACMHAYINLASIQTQDTDYMHGNKLPVVLRTLFCRECYGVRKTYLSGDITNSTKYSFICKGNQKIFSAIKKSRFSFLKKKFVELQMDGR